MAAILIFSGANVLYLFNYVWTIYVPSLMLASPSERFFPYIDLICWAISDLWPAGQIPAPDIYSSAPADRRAVKITRTGRLCVVFDRRAHCND